jgi:hypothetical protein
MLCHISSKLKREKKHKQGEGSSSSSQAQSDTPASLFVIILSFPFIFICTCSFEFIVMFYLTYVMFLLVGHSCLSVATGVASWVLHDPEEVGEEAHVEEATPRSRAGHHPRMIVTWRVHHRGETNSRRSTIG